MIEMQNLDIYLYVRRRSRRCIRRLNRRMPYLNECNVPNHGLFTNISLSQWQKDNQRPSNFLFDHIVFDPLL